LFLLIVLHWGAATYNRFFTSQEIPMDITPPYGYQEVVPLNKEHRVVLPADGTLPPVFRNMMVIPLSYTEFSLACHD
jgi:hypothetical protein